MIWVPLVIVVITIAFVIITYNKLITLRNRCKNAFAQIDVQLKRRYELIPNLIEVAKKFMQHERETLEAVIQARSLSMGASQKAAKDPTNPEAMRELLGAETGLRSRLFNFMAVAEQYPDLKSDSTMRQLSEELTSTENKVSFARQAFNDAVLVYNTALEVFPNNFIGGTFGFKSSEMFKVDDPRERQAVKVNFN